MWKSVRSLWLVMLAPLAPQILGSIFNIWYNSSVIDPLLTEPLRAQFVRTVIVYNALIYPALAAIWIWMVLSYRQVRISISPNAGKTNFIIGGR